MYISIIALMGDCRCPFHNCPNSSYDPVHFGHDELHGDPNVIGTTRVREDSVKFGICVSCIQKCSEHPH